MKQDSLELYTMMYRIRRSEEAIIRYYGEDDMKTPMHMSMGQEAVSVALCKALRDADQIFATYRSHAVFLSKTHNTSKFFAELFGKVSGTARGKAGSMHLSAPEQGYQCSSAIVGSGIPVAVGAAFSNKSKKNGQVACALFGDGAIDEGVFWESLNVSCRMRLPVIFVCEDNGLAVHTPTRQRQGYRDISAVVSQFDCDVAGADSTDVRVMLRIARDCVERVRETARPAFLRFSCYRYLEHVGIAEDFDTGYRAKSELLEWKKKDSLLLERAQLLAEGLSEAGIRETEGEIDREIESSISQAKNDRLPEPEELYEGVFHETD